MGRGDKLALVQGKAESIQSLFDLLTGIKSLSSEHSMPTSKAEVTFRIKVLGIDIEAVNIYELRRQQMFLSENPPIFTGTLRENIDPFHKYTDDDIIRTLDYLGFYEAYATHIKAREQEEVMEFVRKNVRFENEFRHTKSGCCSRRAFALKYSILTRKDIM